MAGEIQIGAQTAALTLYAHVWSAVGTIWNGSAFEAYATANIATYKIALTEKGTASRYYVGTFPAAVAGTYQVTIQRQSGGSPVEGDEYIGAGSYEWDGTVLVPVSSRTKPADTQARVTLVDTVTTYTGNTPQTGDNFARLGAPAGASVSADVAAVKAQTSTINADTDDIQARLPAALTAGGMIKADVEEWKATAVSVPTVAGVPNVNAKTWNDLATVKLPLAPTTAGRDLDVSAGGEAGVDWANVGSPTTVQGLSGTTIKNATDLNTLEVAIKAKTDGLPADPASAATVAASFAAVPAAVWAAGTRTLTSFGTLAADTATAVGALVIETGHSLKDVLKYILSCVSGVSSGGPGTQDMKAPDGVTTRVIVTADDNGNKLTSTLTP